VAALFKMFLRKKFNSKFYFQFLQKKLNKNWLPNGFYAMNTWSNFRIKFSLIHKNVEEGTILGKTEFS
jgi:hypothetical protein